MTSDAKLFRLGKILQEWGIRGQVKFLSFNSETSLYPKLKELLVEDSTEPLILEQALKHNRFWLFKFKGFENPEMARNLRGKVLGIPREEMPAPKKGEIYLSDLEGMKVYAYDGRELGIVRAFLQVGESDVMRIEGSQDEEYLVPYLPQFVQSTSRDEAKIILRESSDEFFTEK